MAELKSTKYCFEIRNALDPNGTPLCALFDELMTAGMADNLHYFSFKIRLSYEQNHTVNPINHNCNMTPYVAYGSLYN